MTPKIAVGYVRCSTDMQEDSIEQQKAEIQRWAKENGYTLIEWFTDEGKSGTSFENRPSFRRMVARVEAGANFEHVLVYDESRWGRAGDPRDSGYWKQHLKRYRVSVRIINSSSNNGNDLGSVVTEVLESAEAGEYSKKLSRSTKRGCTAQAQRGWSSGGSAPYGYTRVALDPRTGEYVRDLPTGVHRRKEEEVVSLRPGDPAEVAVIRRIFSMKATGIGLKTIANTLNAEGVPCPRRGKWRNKDQKWSTGTISSIVQNPVYHGARAYNRFPKNKLSGLPRGKRNPKSEWMIKEDAHPGIITKKQFEKANQVKSFKYAGGSAMAVRSPYLLSGLIQCSICGFNYTGYTRGSKGLRYYADSGFINKGKAVCKWHAIPQDHLEGFIVGTIRDKLLNSVVPQRLESLIEQYLSTRQSIGEDPLVQLETKLSMNQKRLENLLSAVEEGINVETIIPRIKEIEVENNRLDSEIEKLKRIRVTKATIRNAASEASRFIRTFEQRLEQAPMVERKLMIRQIVQRITVDRKKNQLSCQFLRVPATKNPILRPVLKDRVVQSSVCPEPTICISHNRVPCI